MKIKELFKSSTRSNDSTRIDPKNQQELYSKGYKLEDIKKAESIIDEESEKTGQNFKETNIKKKQYSVSELGAYSFKMGLFKDELKTPHYEIQKTLEAFEEMPSINEGINKIVLFITGNDIKITSEDEYTTKWYEKWLKQRPEMSSKVKELITLCEVTGNCWIEPYWDTVKGDTVYMNDFKIVPDPSRVYYNIGVDVKDDNEFWIYQVPYIFRSFGDINVNLYRITYIKNGIGWQETVYGIPLAKNELIHFKIGWSRYGYYGRSYVSSTNDKVEIMQQMLKNYAIASRYMAFGKKVFSVEGDDGQLVPSTEVKEITDVLNSPEDEEHIVINRKLHAQEITPTQFNEMSGPLDFLRRTIGSGMEPSFMTPWAETVTYASANKAAIPFELNLENKRQTYIDLLNRYILENVRKQNPKLKDATFEFGNVSLEDPSELRRTAIELYDNDIITFNQMLKELNYETVENGDIYKSHRNYIMQKKYQMEQSDVEQYDEPYMTRAIQKDKEDEKDDPQKPQGDTDEFGEPEESGETGEPLQESMKEQKQVTNKDDQLKDVSNPIDEIRTDKDFLKKIKDKDAEIIQTKDIKDSNILRVVKRKVEQMDVLGDYFVYNNLSVMKRFGEEKLAKKYMELLSEEIKLEYDNFLKGNTPEDELSEELFKKMKEIQWEIAQEILNETKEYSTKENYFKGKKIFKEKNVLQDGILNRLSGLFDRFNYKMKSAVDDAVEKSVQKHGVEVEIVDDMDSTQNEEFIQKKDMIKDLIFSQFQTFNQEQSQNIKRIMSDGIIAGKSIAEIKRDLKEEVIDWKKRAPSDADFRVDRIAHTEIHRGSLQLKLLRWEMAGVKYVKYLAHIDDATRPHHKRLHNRIFKIEDALKLDTWKEIHCRCVFRPMYGL